MPFKILCMIAAFLIGIAFEFLKTKKKASLEKTDRLRILFYQATVMYLLFKIGFVGGTEVVSQSLQMIVSSGLFVIVTAGLWTLFVLLVLNRWSSFDPITQISIVSHFGSVSVGTFIAAMAFLSAMEIAVNPSVAIWLALMEFPAITIGIWKLGVRANTIVPILKEKWSLAILPISILLGVFFGKFVPVFVSDILFGVLFLPALFYFLFEMGRKAEDSIGKLKENIGSVFFIGIAIPILGGLFGSSAGYWVGYDAGSMFIMAILMASASYVLAPLCMQEVLKSIYKPDVFRARQVVATSMALSVGVTLPFNILIGFELYHVMIQALQTSRVFAVFGLAIPLAVAIISFFRRSRFELIE